MKDEEINKGTAQPGSEPGNKDGKDAGAAPAPKGQEGDSPTPDEDESKLPFNQHPKWKSARETEKKVQDILKANGLDSFDDLVDLLETGKTIKGKGIDVAALDEIVNDSKTLKKYQAYWKDQEERKLRESETTEERAERLERELEQRKAREAQDKKQKEVAEANAKAIREYEKEVKELLSDLPKDSKAFLGEFLGVGNPCNEIDLTDKKAIKSLVAEGKKKLETFQQATIKAYLAGKLEIPDIGPASGGGKPTLAETGPKNMKEARSMAAQLLKGSS
jgi:hypothetical protein